MDQDTHSRCGSNLNSPIPSSHKLNLVVATPMSESLKYGTKTILTLAEIELVRYCGGHLCKEFR